jgi:hypothetical protein
VRRFVSTLIALATLCAALSGCGWLGANSASRNKPSAFVLRGYVSVAGAAAGQSGAECQAPSAGITATSPVQVTDPPGHVLTTGVLGPGVLATDGGAYHCNFPFELPGVPGGHNEYGIRVGDRPAVSFPATELRQDKPAVIAVPAT